MKQTPDAQEVDADKAPLVSNRVIEIAVGALLLAVGALIVFDAHRLGSGWGDDGPKSGYFPFYIGLILCFASVVAVIQALRSPSADEGFVERGQARLILAVLIPTILYVIVVRLVGIYVASALFIGAFMAWQGKFGWLKCVTVSIMVTVGLFLMFELWFKVPLPKGPIEALLGF